jgi:hypothetical protein
VFNPMMFNSVDAGAGPLYEVHAIVVASATVCINAAQKSDVPEEPKTLSRARRPHSAWKCVENQ